MAGGAVGTQHVHAVADGLQDGGEVFLDDVDEEALGFLLYPEEDFYLDEAGNAVFFFQPGDVKPEAEGPVLVPIPLEDIMDEL